MTAKEKKANAIRRLSAQLKADLKIALSIRDKAIQFACNIIDKEVASSDPNVDAVALNLQHFYTAIETSQILEDEKT